jgi:predicted RNA-binding Zn-ribbon protein involved in translation (DUF1610 family)
MEQEMNDIGVRLALSFFMSMGICMLICELLTHKPKKRGKYLTYDSKLDKFYCPQCGRELSMQLTFLETCPFCKNSY